MIVGFSLQEINAERKAARQGNLNVNFGSSIKDVEETQVTGLDETVARITFLFPITYQQQEEDVAEIRFKGTVLWQKDVEDVLEHWEENEALEDQVSMAVTNHIIRKCLSQAVGLADSLELPSPVPMPKVQQQQ